MRWRIQLVGEDFDLEELPKLFTSDDARVTQADGKFHLTSTSFESLDNASEVRERAQSLISHINGAARLVFDQFKPVSLGAVSEARPEGRHISFAFSEVLRVRSKTSVVRVGDGKAASSPTTAPPPVVSNTWLRLALHDDVAAHVLRLLGKSPTTWSDLYKVMELLQANGGNALLAALQFSSAKVSRFTQTANSMNAIGDQARHAKLSIPAPAQPMDLSDAKAMMHAWTRAWLNQRAQATTAHASREGTA